MTSLKTIVGDMRAGEETLEALKQGRSHYDMDGVSSIEMYLGASAGVATLEVHVHVHR